MASATKEAPLTKSAVSGFDFAVEADERRNGDVVLQAIPGVRLRGAIDATKPIIADPKQNMREFEAMVPPEQSTGLGMLPKIPGQIIYVNPQKCSYRIVDPLRDNEALCDRIANGLRRRGENITKIVGVKTLEGTIDKDQMKTLCRELRWLVDSGDARNVGAGEVPSMEEIDKLPGDYLLNPGSRTPNMQPRLEKQYAAWIERLSQGGG